MSPSGINRPELGEIGLVMGEPSAGLSGHSNKSLETTALRQGCHHQLTGSLAVQSTHIPTSAVLRRVGKHGWGTAWI